MGKGAIALIVLLDNLSADGTTKKLIMGSNNAVTTESRNRRMQKNAQYTIDKSDDLTIRRLLLDRLTENYRTVQKIMGKACPLSRTSIGRWEKMLNELSKENLIVVKWDSIPLYIEIKKAAA